MRFLEYASIEYDDVIYMSPMDFIDSLTRDAPRGERELFDEDQTDKHLIPWFSC